MLLTLSSLVRVLLKQETRTFFSRRLCSVGISDGHSYSRKRGGTSRVTPGASRNVPDEVALKNVCLVARAR